MYGENLAKITSYPRAQRRVEIPVRNFLAVDFEVEDFINDNVIDFANRMLEKYGD